MKTLTNMRRISIKASQVLALISLVPCASLSAQESLNDGPYLNWLSNGNVSVEAVCDSERFLTTLKGSSSFLLSDPCTGEAVTTVTKAMTIPGDSFENVDRYLALSDVEGHYDDFVQLLQTYKVIDSDRKWSWGTGHLVLLGDMVDRGDKVTEVLWMIHRLEKEAALAGGHLHYVLGNHEKMTLEGDARYLHPKYTEVTDILGKSYSELYGKSTELGRWMRSRNAMVKLNGTLFLHAGLSPELLSYASDVSEINRAIRRGLNDPSLKKTDAQIKWLLSSDGPLWYRGYFQDEELKVSDVKRVLSGLGLERVVVGHTIMPQIDFHQGGLVIAVDTSFAKTSKIQALYYNKGKYGRALISGKIEALTQSSR